MKQFDIMKLTEEKRAVIFALLQARTADEVQKIHTENIELFLDDVALSGVLTSTRKRVHTAEIAKTLHQTN